MSQMLDTVSNALANIQLGYLNKSDSEFDIEADEAKFQAARILDRENVEDLANVLRNHMWLILENVESKACHLSGFLALRSLFINSTFIRVQLMRNVVNCTDTNSNNLIILKKWTMTKKKSMK